jgi:hypothetical protein
MHVHDLLQLDPLDLTLLWGERRRLTREIGAVTATDPADPRRFPQHGEIVLSGLVRWHPADGRATTDRFVAAPRTTGAVALPAGEETHGAVPDVLVDSCRANGVPADVRAAFRARVLGPLADGRTASHRMLLDTLGAFLAHSGSWTRTAEALRLHVNTVHYRVQRVEALTGRDLSRLKDKLDLRAALLCG